MPAVSKVRQFARSIMCMGNVRRLAIAGSIYVVENNDQLPPFRMKTRSATDPSVFVNEYGREKPRWPWFFDHDIGPVIDPAPYIKAPGDTFGDHSDEKALIMTNNYFMCPSFNHGDYDKRDIRNGSYGYNYQYLGNSRITNSRYHNFPIKAMSLGRPGEVIMIADSRGIDVPHGIHAYTLDPPRLTVSAGARNFAKHDLPTRQEQHSPAEARHDKNANVSFLDGHAEKKELQELGYILRFRWSCRC